MRKKEIRSKAIATKHGTLQEFWFKPYSGKFSRKKFVEKYVWKHVFQSIALDKWRTSYKPLDQKVRKIGKEEIGSERIVVLEWQRLRILISRTHGILTTHIWVWRNVKSNCVKWRCLSKKEYFELSKKRSATIVTTF
jgi:hypothetical protein